MRCVCLGILAAILASCGSVHADQILYDATSGVYPESAPWGWTYASQSASGASTVRSINAGAGLTTLDTTANNDIGAGYLLSTPTLPALDRSTGYTISLNLQVLTESHASNDRAGFSLIVLGSDHEGIELDFWTDRVFAQSSTFTHAEEAFINTTVLTTYDLAILGNTYTLYADGSSLLTGELRDYATSGIPPYTQPNVVFLGDDTRSASGSVSFGSVNYISRAVPEPSSAMLLAGGIAMLAMRGWRRAKARKS